MTGALLGPVRRLWRQLRGCLRACLSWQEVAVCQPALPSDDVERFAALCREGREQALQKMFGDLCAHANRLPGHVRIVARITGDNRPAIEAIARCCGAFGGSGTDLASTGRFDVMEFVTEHSPGACETQSRIAGTRATKSRSHTSTLWDQETATRSVP